jgi:hypothetical protein
MKDERIYLRHILECIEAVQDYNAQGRDAFLTDRKTCKATLRELQELGRLVFGGGKEWFSGPATLLLDFAQQLVGTAVGTVGRSVLEAAVTTTCP